MFQRSITFWKWPHVEEGGLVWVGDGVIVFGGVCFLINIGTGRIELLFFCWRQCCLVFGSVLLCEV